MAELWPSLLLTMQVKWPQSGEMVIINIVPLLETLPTALVMSALSWRQLNLGSVPQASLQTSKEWDTLMLTETWWTASGKTDKQRWNMEICDKYVGKECSAGWKQEDIWSAQPWASICYRLRIMAHGCPRGSQTKNHERHLMLSGETGSVSETIMRSEREA